ncbi:MAG: RNA methyltransferase [bacterium]|nr:RNA methyltransferase [bacterium]
MISSPKNVHLKEIRRIRRRAGDAALLEGPHLIGEALAAGVDLRSLLAAPDFLAGAAGRRLAGRLPRSPLMVEPDLLAEITDSDSPRGIVGIAQLPRAGASALPVVGEGVYVYAEGMQDPGNLGALARVAEASGVAGVCLSPGSTHPNHPRALRASAGSLLRLPVAIRTSPDALSAHLDALRPQWVALVPRGGRDLYQESLSGCVILTIGAEGSGLSDPTRRRAATELTIPLSAPVESLNTTVAAAVVLFEIRRRRTSS